MQSVLFGLNLSLAVSQEDLERVDEAARQLEAAAPAPVDLAKNLDKIQGRWKLVYSCAFSS
jgi:hypothetical protein